MKDPNRIVERVESLVRLAANAIEEAEGILEGAMDDGEDQAVLDEAEGLINNFWDWEHE